MPRPRGAGGELQATDEGALAPAAEREGDGAREAVVLEREQREV